MIFFSDMRLVNSNTQWQVNRVLQDEKDFNEDMRIEGPAGAKIWITIATLYNYYEV